MSLRQNTLQHFCSPSTTPEKTMSIRTESVAAVQSHRPMPMSPRATTESILKDLGAAADALYGTGHGAYQKLRENTYKVGGYIYEFSKDFTSARVYPDGIGEGFELDLRGDLGYQLNKHAVTMSLQMACYAQITELARRFPEGSWAVHGPNTRPNGEIAFRIAGPEITDPSTNTQVIYNPQTGTVRTIARDGSVWPKQGQVRSAGTPADAMKAMIERFPMIRPQAHVAGDEFAA
jgi:hypothetical protein